MPGAVNDLAVEQPLGERAAVVGAGRADREAASANPSDEHGVVADVAADHRPVRELRCVDPRGEIGAGG